MASLQHIKKAHHEVSLIGIRGYELRSADKGRDEGVVSIALLGVRYVRKSVLGLKEVLIMRGIVTERNGSRCYAYRRTDIQIEYPLIRRRHTETCFT